MKVISRRRRAVVVKIGPSNARVVRRGTEVLRAIPEERQDALIALALFNARVEGFQIPASVVRDGKKMLSGKTTADELVGRYKLRYCRN